MTWSLICSFSEDFGPIQCLSLNHTLDIVSSFHDNTIKLWTTENKQIKFFSSFICPIFNPQEILFFSETSYKNEIKSNYIVIGNFEGNLFFYIQDEKDHYKNEKVIKKHKGAIYKLFYNGFRNVVISSSCEDNMIFFWELEKFEMLHNFALHDVRRIRGVHNSFDGQFLVFTAGMEEIFFLDLENYQLAGSYFLKNLEFMECISTETRDSRIIISFAKDRNRKNYYCIEIIYF